MASNADFPIELYPVPLTASSFAPFGNIIATPLSPQQSKIPHPPPQGTVAANQNTALKVPGVTPFSSTYHLSPSGIPARPVMSMFSCFSRQLGTRGDGPQDTRTRVFDVRILERHPYTTQTFVPLASAQPSAKKALCLVVVAPTLPTPPVLSSGTPYFPQASSSAYRQNYGGMPDLHNIKAFIAEPGVGITYGVGTWHAPMVIVGGGRVDFVVSQWMSGRSEEDCQEVELGEGISVLLDEPVDESFAKSKL